jgi:hypothetical protein
MEVVVLNVTAIATQVNRDAIGACMFAGQRRRNDTGFRRASGLPHSSNVIDVYIQTSRHPSESSLSVVRCQCLSCFPL